MSEEGYVKSCKEIIGAARKLIRQLGEQVPEVRILGDPKVSVVAFTSDVVNILEVGDRLSKKGWHCEQFFPVLSFGLMTNMKP